MEDGHLGHRGQNATDYVVVVIRNKEDFVEILSQEIMVYLAVEKIIKEDFVMCRNVQVTKYAFSGLK